MTTQKTQGLTITRLQPGGKDGPNGAVKAPVRGGNVWTEAFHLGHEGDPDRLSIPDIRMPANQYWPLHWHDTWIAVVVLDGECMIGDWWMTRGDVLISAAYLEYGPVLNGPEGCQLLEIFHREKDSPGGYGPEYHDHPTLNLSEERRGMFPFLPRSPENQRNVGNQTLPMDGIAGLTKGRLKGGQRFDLGEPNDPSRGALLDTKLAPGEIQPPHWHADWRALLVLSGSLKVGDAELARDSVLLAEPNIEIGPFEAGRDGVHMLEVTRTVAGVPATYREQYRTDPKYRDFLAKSQDAAFAKAPAG